MADDGPWLKSHAGGDEEEMTVAAAGRPPYGFRDEHASGQTANASTTDCSLENAG